MTVAVFKELSDFKLAGGKFAARALANQSTIPPQTKTGDERG